MQLEAHELVVRQLSPFGLEIGLDLRQPIGPELQAQLSATLYSQGLLVFRGQALDLERQVEIMDGFGPVLRAPEGINVVSTDPEKGWGGTGELKFHADLAFSPHPCKVISLYALEVEDGETSTLFASGLLACQRMPGALRRRLAGVMARMQMPRLYAGADAGTQTPAWLPRTDHPAIMNHPVTGAPLVFVNELQTAGLEGVSPDEGVQLLAEVFAWLYEKALVYEHRWTRGDLVIWDNIALQHARSALPVMTRRTLQRVIVAEKRFSELYPDVPQAELVGR